MVLKRLELSKFRNFSNLQLDFNEGLNVIIGQNGVGKTNIVEAIHYLSLARSFRTNYDDALIKHGQEEATIKAYLDDEHRTHKIEITIGKDGKRVRHNDIPLTRLSTLAELVNVVVFEPKDVNFFNGPPSLRRNYLDVHLGKTKNLYLNGLSTYENLLRERNSALKKDNIDTIEIDVLQAQMVEASEVVTKGRAEFIRNLNEILPKVLKELDPSLANIKVNYKPFVTLKGDYKTNAEAVFNKAKANDYKYRSTSVGPQREDFITELNGQDVSEYASQGQKRIIALALAISPYFIATNRQKRPIIVLDDALSELDANHQQRLVKFINKFNQTFITTTSFPYQGSELYEVTKNQKVIRRRFV